jgi:hypothetical protein
MLKDNEIKNEISAILSSALDLKIMVHYLAEENRELRTQLAFKASMKLGELGYFYADCGPHPFAGNSISNHLIPRLSRLPKRGHLFAFRNPHNFAFCSHRILSRLLARSSDLFPQKDVPFGIKQRKMIHRNDEVSGCWACLSTRDSGTYDSGSQFAVSPPAQGIVRDIRAVADN